jgi:SagB-type dehydrogenase family enzyme
MAPDPRTSIFEFHDGTKTSGAFRLARAAFKKHFSEEVHKLMTRVENICSLTNTVALPKPRVPGGSLIDAIVSRESYRDWNGGSISLEQLHSFLYYSIGYRDEARNLRFNPSSGGLGSVKVHVICLRVDNLEQGIYTYLPREKRLLIVCLGNFQNWVERNVTFQRKFRLASVLFILESDVSVVCSKYGTKGYRLAAVDIGIVCQLMYSIGTSLGLGVCATAGFIDYELEEALKLDNKKSVPALIFGCGPRPI